MDSKRASIALLGEQLIRGRDRKEKERKKMIDNIYRALSRGRDRYDMDWDFFNLAGEYGLHIDDIAQAPNTPGYYMLFAGNGEFIYVGKTSNLHQRLNHHFGPNEENERIKGIVEYVIWEQTQTVAEAEEAEGHLYDTWVRRTGLPPFANKNKPPKSKLKNNEIMVSELRQILQELRSLKN